MNNVLASTTLAISLLFANQAYAGDDPKVAAEIMALARAQWAGEIAGQSAAEQMATSGRRLHGVQCRLSGPYRRQGIERQECSEAFLSDSGKTLVADMVNPKVQVYGDTAILTYNFVGAARDKDGKVSANAAKSTRVYSKIGGKWMLVHANFAPAASEYSAADRRAPAGDRAGRGTCPARRGPRGPAGPTPVASVEWPPEHVNPDGHGPFRRHPGRRPGQAHEVGPAQGPAAARRPAAAAHVIDTARELSGPRIHVVYGHGGEQVREALAGGERALGAAGRAARHRPCGAAGDAGDARTTTWCWCCTATCRWCRPRRCSDWSRPPPAARRSAC